MPSEVDMASTRFGEGIFSLEEALDLLKLASKSAGIT
jgi:hypothetical protein